MIQALQLEERAVRKMGKRKTIELLGGEKKGTSGGNSIYTFPVLDDFFIKDDSPIKLAVASKETDGFVVSFSEGILIIALTEDLGPKISSARLLVDDIFLIEAIRKKLQEVQTGTASLHKNSAFGALGLRKGVCGEKACDESFFHGDQVLNSEQKLFIKKALGSEITYLWGPPGTGKTTTLACLAEIFYKQGMSVLIVSNTNIAVDTMLEKVCHRLESIYDEDFQKGSVVRVGPIVKAELRDRYSDFVVLDSIVPRLAKPLLLEKMKLESDRSKIEQLLRPLKDARAGWKKYRDVSERLPRVTADIESNLSNRRNFEKKILALQQERSRIDPRIEEIKRMNFFKRLFTVETPESLERRKHAISVEEGLQQGMLDQAIKKGAGLTLKLEQYKSELITITEEVKAYLPLEDCEKQILNGEADLKVANDKIVALDTEIQELREKVIANARMVATTVYRTYIKGQLKRTFDVAIIDEASMIPLPMCFYASGLAAKKVVIGGDFRQLSPIVMSDDLLAEKWLKTDVFHKAKIPKEIREGRRPDALSSLNKQYRMNKVLCSLINENFYPDNQLETCRLTHQPDNGFPFGKTNLLYVNTASLHPWAACKMGTYSRYNLLHAILVRNFVSHLVKRGFFDPSNDDNQKIGVISPYAAQANLLKHLLDEQFDKRGSRFTATVHSFQGNEKDVIVLELADSIGVAPSKFVKAVSVEEDGARLMNVALSRARDHVILIANFDYLKEKLSPDSIVVRSLNKFEREGEEIKIGKVLTLGPDEWIDVAAQLSAPSFDFDFTQSGLFTEATFYGGFTEDLAKAKNFIVIFSPFLTARGTARWIDILRAKIGQGVKVRLVTRPPGAQGGVLEEGLAELINQIRALGVVVDLREKLHEKIAVIDNRILWHGSLNIFSHRDTSESMMRLCSEAACQQTIRFISVPVRGRNSKDEEFDIAKQENPLCPGCSNVMILIRGREGFYFECGSCERKSDNRSPQGQRGRRAGRATVRCKVCGSPMAVRSGRRGKFLGCSAYPGCRYTQDLQNQITP